MLRRSVLMAALAAAGAARAQEADDFEKRIASLPADQRAYERYRAWLSRQAQGVQNPLERYRAELVSRGMPAREADAQVALIREKGGRAEVERWNRILTAEKPRFNTEPNAFLMEIARGRKPGTALDVGMGQGRNAIWLAQQGWAVTGFDPAEKAVEAARRRAASLGVKLATEVKGSEDFDFGENRWDLILLSYVGARDVAEQVQRGLKRGGVAVVEAFHRDATKGASIGGAVVFDSGELPSLFRGLRAVRYEEPIAAADFGSGRVRVVRYCGEKPE